MNIASEIHYNPEKPSVVSIEKGDRRTALAIGLMKGQLFPKHTTKREALLVVLEGEILFRINEEEISLNKLDTFIIPADIEHEVIGKEQHNCFLIVK